MTAPSVMPRIRNGRPWIAATLMLGTITTLLAATVINVAFPALMDEMHVGHDTVQWLATGFLAATTATMLASAWALARFGERSTFIAMLALIFRGLAARRARRRPDGAAGPRARRGDGGWCRMTRTTEPRFVMVAGLVLFAVSAALFALTGAGTGWWTFVAWLVIGRVGLGLLIPALNVGAVQSLSGHALAQGSAAIHFLRQLGGAAGVNLLAVYLQWRLDALDAAQAPRAYHECFILVAVAFIVAIVAAGAARRPGE